MLNRREMLRGAAGMLASGALVLAADDNKKEDTGKTEPNAEAVKAELKKLQGSWEAVSLEAAGEKAPEKEVAKAKFDIKDNKMVAKNGDTTDEMVIDPTRKPKTINLITEITIKELKKGDKVARTRKEKQLLKGIYTLEGETLTFCLPINPKADRPTKIESSKGVVIAVFKRQQP